MKAAHCSFIGQTNSLAITIERFVFKLKTVRNSGQEDGLWSSTGLDLNPTAAVYKFCDCGPVTQLF